MIAIIDITERKKAEEKLQNAYREIEQRVEERTAELKVANKSLKDEIEQRKQIEDELVKAKAQAELYVDLMGHDINNMNMIVMSYLELAKEMMPADSAQKEFLDNPLNVLERSTQLISNVRKLQKLQNGVLQLESVDVCKVVADVQREFRATPRKAITVNMNGCERCLARANDLLRDVFVNLVGNAIKHTGERAEIIIDLDAVSENGGRYCRVMVEDNGPGIPDDFKAKIFNRLIKGTDNAKGMGLGLFLVKSLVENYHGRVWVEDRVPGDHTKGARFVVMLPAVSD
jgi:signal transduction histidine kinase